MMTPDEVIKELRDNRNLSHVARSVGMSRVHISGIANGRSPNVPWKTIKLLSDHLESDNTPKHIIPGYGRIDQEEK